MHEKQKKLQRAVTLRLQDSQRSHRDPKHNQCNNKSRNGEVLLTEREQSSRWVEHFNVPEKWRQGIIPATEEGVSQRL